MYSDLFLIVVMVLLVLTIVASYLYYTQIKAIREEYEEAKNTVGDIIISFNSQCQRQEDRIRDVTQKLESIFSERKEVVKKVKEYDDRLDGFTNITKIFPEIEQKFSKHVEEMNKKLGDLEGIQDRMLQRIGEVEKQKYKIPMPEAKIEAVIPIKKERALAPLTETELAVLETIAKDGERTTPEIREQIKLTREHTARLMKKLYEGGYLDRDTNRMPYTYRLKEEMKKILKKKETKN